MMNEERKKIMNNILKIISATVLIYSLLICAILLINYLNLRKYSLPDSERMLSLLERIDEDPQNNELREAYRSLDLVSRKAFFVSTAQINSGKILLIIGLVVFFFSTQFSFLISKPAFPVQRKRKDKEKDPLLIKHFAVLAVTIIMLVPALVLSWRNSDLISGARGSGVRFVSLDKDTQGYWSSFRNMGRPYPASDSHPLSWDAETGENIVWEKNIELPGFSSPVVWDDHIYLTSGDSGSFRIECYRLDDGELVWEHDMPVENPDNLPQVQADTGYAAPTPAASREGIFAVFATGEIVALDHKGKALWSRQLDVPANHYGHSSSLLTYSGMLLVQFDTNDETWVAAFDEKNGEEIWKTDRSGEISWTSPILAEWNERVYLLLNSSPSVSAYEPATGRLIWETECLSGEVAPSLAFADGIVSAAQTYSVVCSLDIETGELLWEGDGALPDVSSPVSTGAFLFVPSSYGTITALNPADFSEYWFFEQYDGFYSSPVIAGDRLYISDLAGLTTVLAVSETMEVIGEGLFPEPVYATPAFTERGIVYRTETMLYLAGGEED